MPGERLELPYADAIVAFERIWRNPNVQSDLRLYICGAVHSAGRRQGDEVIPSEIWEKIVIGSELALEEVTTMVESVHEFAFVKFGLRPQYVFVILHQIDRFLSEAAQQAYRELVFEESLKGLPSQN